ncbi:MAG TPA: glycoside hydrolase [Candidatus Angelobacter sp.]|nr:glycoside hydrolase [Candidatus Angelobacter sp.]
MLSFTRRLMLPAVIGTLGTLVFFSPASNVHAQQAPQTTPSPKPKVQMAPPAREPQIPLKGRVNHNGQHAGQAQPQPGPLTQLDPALLESLRWRNIGPYRGGRTRAISGVPSEPNVFYIGVCNGGVWKTNDFGRTWQPIFDKEPTGSIGAVAVSPSDPNIVYVGSGEGLHRPDLSVGDGIYKSTDAGKTWTHLGLRNGQQIPELAVDPQDPNKVFAAVAGHPYGPNPERGIYRSTDGGQNWQKVLPSGEKANDENIGGDDVLIDPGNSNIVYATLWESREGPWENAAWDGPNGGIFKSTDGGATFTELSGGLPQGIIQAHLAISQSNPQMLFASVATKQGVKLYRTDDGGANWTVATSDPRPAGRIGGGDLPEPGIDPKNPDVIYMTSIVTWKSSDGGKTWTGLRGAPGGDDYQNIWINPNDPRIILLASDQGAIITVNGGQSWSSWYNQSTAQMYHVNADNAFPYRLCSGQQESGSACVSSRGNDGEVTIREWHPVAAEEYGYVVPDPLNPDIVYGGKLTRYDRRTGQAQNVIPKAFRSQDFRVLRTEPIVFSPIDPEMLFFASNVLWKTTDGGKDWQQISPDLTRKSYPLPASIGIFSNQPTAKVIQRGVIYAVAPSPRDINLIWAGTDDGQIQVTRDGGKHWSNVTPANMTAFQKVSIIEASHFDPQTAYAAINTLRLDDLRPHILRTRDGGKTWMEIVSGIPSDENVNAVREDPVRRGLLFASTERAVYVSFDDGDHWQSLRLNMPASSVRDVIVKNDDLAAGTHGRGFWILDDITPLRQIDQKVLSSQAHLFKPQTAMRVRWDTNTDTPLPPDFPAGQNPPDGAIIDYYLQSAPSGPVTLEIKDRTGKMVRKYSSADKPQPIDPMLNIPTYWVRPPQVLSAEAGMHRFLWDMHYPDVPGAEKQYPIAAVPHNTAPQPTGPWVMPGNYTVVLTVDGKSYSQPLTVKMDPRVKTPTAGLQQQFAMSDQAYNRLLTLVPAVDQGTQLRKQVEDRLKVAPEGSEAAAALTQLNNRLNAVLGPPRQRFAPPSNAPSLSALRAKYGALFGMLQEADVAPTTEAKIALAQIEKQLPPLLRQWQELKTRDLPAANQKLKSAGQPELTLAALNPNARAVVSARDKDEE